MKSIKLLLFLVLFLTSCAAPATSIIVPTQTLTSEPTAKPTATQTPIPTPTIIPSPTQIGGGSGRLIFTSYRKDEFIEAFPDLKGETNIFVANADGSVLTLVSNGLEGYNYLQDVSPDGVRILIASTAALDDKTAGLYLVDLSSNVEPVKIADGVPNNYGYNVSAKWLDNTNIVYVGQGDLGFGIHKVNADGTSLETIFQYNNDGEAYRPFEVLAIDQENARIYWDTRNKVRGLAAMYDVYNVWWTSLDGNSERNPLEFNGKQLQFTNESLVFSPDGTKVAWIEETTPASLHIASVSDIDTASTLETISSQLTMNWFPDNSKLLVFDKGSLGHGMTCDEAPTNDTTSDLYGVYEVSITPSMSIKNYHLPAEKLMTCESWGGNAYYITSEIHDISPDGRQFLLVIRRSTEVGTDSKLNFLNVETLSFSEASNSTFSNTVGNFRWIP